MTDLLSEAMYEGVALKRALDELSSRQEQLGKQIKEVLDYAKSNMGQPAPHHEKLSTLYLEQNNVSSALCMLNVFHEKNRTEIQRLK